MFFGTIFLFEISTTEKSLKNRERASNQPTDQKRENDSSFCVCIFYCHIKISFKFTAAFLLVVYLFKRKCALFSMFLSFGLVCVYLKTKA